MTVVFKGKRFLKYFGISLLMAILFTLIIVFLIPLILHIILIPREVGDILLLATLLTISYFGLICLISRFAKKRYKKIILTSICALALTVIVVGIISIVNTLIFFKSTNVGEYDYDTYAVVVRKDSDYQSIAELNGKTMGVMSESHDVDAIDTLEKGTELTFSVKAIDGGLSNLANELLDQQVDAICLEQGKSTFLNDSIDGFNDKTRVI